MIDEVAEFLRLHPGEHRTRDLAKMFGVTTARIKTALNNSTMYPQIAEDEGRLIWNDEVSSDLVEFGYRRRLYVGDGK